MGKTNTTWTPNVKRDTMTERKKSRAKGGLNLISRATEQKGDRIGARSQSSAFPAIDTNRSQKTPAIEKVKV